MRTALAILLLLSATAAPAAAPELAYLYPAGAQRGTSVAVVAGGKFARWPVKVWASDRGIEVSPAKQSGKLAVKVGTNVAPGTYWLRLHDDEGASVAKAFLVGAIPEVNEKEPNDDARKAQPIEAAHVIVNGRLEKAGDVDCFAVKLRKGETLVAAVEAHKPLLSPMDGVLQILNADGFVLAQNDDYHGFDPLATHTAAADETCVVRLFAFPSVPDASIRFAGGEKFVYRLTLTTKGYVDYAFPLSVSQKEKSTVEPVGWNIPAALKSVPVPPADRPDAFTFSGPDLANLLHVNREPWPCLAVANAPRTAPQALPLPAVVTGRFDDASDGHFYTFDAKKGKSLTFRAESRTLDLQVEPVLRVLDGAGKQLARAEAPKLNDDAALTFAAPADGRYLLHVSDLHEGAGRRHVYRLRAGPTEPDFALTVVADRFTLTPGKPLDIPVTVERKGGFGAEVELTAEGLPPGVTAKAAPAKAGAKTATLTLTAAGGAAGPFRIVGSAKGLTRRAHAAGAAVERVTEDLWLTAAAGGPAK